ncbi:peptidase domain-containing ABC transporter [Mobiluncus mulieris]|uniref:Peptidase domain-containing ABC transporter n=1 Tax=Mobiluncus mulieris TaxID=2052 RepID=A0A7Y0UUJ0_9ACTO|nr:peptidase domain-containing ABC transporter [Mobiluncus mulieris]NMX03992.1 peptidase domain-containing ABC transporter [Mobiluncus mulieris]NMX11975.1 peptidase domain-containing ABC transporter [Mobiluncus mulieris]
MARIKPTYQVAQSDCGLACIHMLMQAHGTRASIRKMRVHYAPGRNGLTVSNLATVLHDYGLATRAFKCSYSYLSDIPLPAIIAWAPKHYVILEKKRNRGWQIIDPASGRRICDEQTTQESFRNLCIIVKDSSGAKKSKEIREESSWVSLSRILFHKLSLFIPLFLGVVLVAFTTLIIPELTANLIARYQSNSNGMIWGVISGIVFAFFLVQLLNVIMSTLAATQIGKHLSEAIFHRLLNAPLSYFLIRPQGELLYRISLVKILENFVTNSFPKALISVVLSLISATYIAVVNTVSFMVLVVATIIYLLIFHFSRRKINDITELLNVEESLANSVLVDSITSIQVVKAGGHEKNVFSNWCTHNEKTFIYEKKRAVVRGAVNSFLSSMQNFFPIVVFLVTYWQSSHTPDIANALKVQLLATIYLSQISLIVEFGGQIGEASAAVRRIDDILSYQDYSIFSKDAHSDFSMPISLNKVSFRYGAFSNSVINNFSLILKSNTKIAIIGKTGCGKSTVAKLVAGLLNPSSGSIKIAGESIHNVKQHSFYRNVTYIPQDSPLRSASLRENLDWNKSHTDDELLVALKQAQFDLDSGDFPQGLDTVLVNGGQNISGGQRQRIAIARVFLNRPQLIILDEATSGLDQKTEAELYTVFENMQCALLAITHRLETVRTFDQIVVLENGRVVESGTFDALIESKGVLFSMYNAYKSERMRSQNDCS